jgi:hypothetical protein
MSDPRDNSTTLAVNTGERKDMSRNDLIILGRKIGTYEAWADLDDGDLLFTNFEPVAGVALFPDCSLNVLIERGEFIQFPNAPTSNVATTSDIIDTIKHLPRI